MYTKEDRYFLPREIIYEQLTKENEYASRWAKDKKSKNPDFPDNTVNRSNSEPFSMMDWIVFTEKYIDEAKTCYANYVPDLGAVRIRLIKAASLLVTCLQVHGEYDDLGRLAGNSSADFPIMHGGLKTFDTLKEKYGEDKV